MLSGVRFAQAVCGAGLRGSSHEGRQYNRLTVHLKYRFTSPVSTVNRDLVQAPAISRGLFSVSLRQVHVTVTPYAVLHPPPLQDS
jgi:hypothetical protein